MFAYLSLVYTHVYLRFADTITNCPTGDNNANCQTTLPEISANSETIHIALQFLFGALGAVSLLYITIMGYRYVISQGKPEELSKARDGIIYAVVGLVIAISAEAIITFLLNRL